MGNKTTHLQPVGALESWSWKLLTKLDGDDLSVEFVEIILGMEYFCILYL